MNPTPRRQAATTPGSGGPEGPECRRARGLWGTDSAVSGMCKSHTLGDPGQKQQFERSLG